MKGVETAALTDTVDVVVAQARVGTLGSDFGIDSHVSSCHGGRSSRCNSLEHDEYEYVANISRKVWAHTNGELLGMKDHGERRPTSVEKLHFTSMSMFCGNSTHI